MIKKNLKFKLFCLVFLCVVLSGCFSSKYVDRKYYLFNLGERCHSADICKRPHVVFNKTSIAQEYDQLYFLYRINCIQYVTDYYHAFLVPPATQFDSAMMNYFKAHANFYPVTFDTLVESNLVLQARINELYADYQCRNDPRAIMTVQFILTKLEVGKTVILFDKTFRARVPLKEKTTDCLLAAWNEGLRNILSCATHDLDSVTRIATKNAR